MEIVAQGAPLASERSYGRMARPGGGFLAVMSAMLALEHVGQHSFFWGGG